jgi:hypothetical protein
MLSITEPPFFVIGLTLSLAQEAKKRQRQNIDRSVCFIIVNEYLKINE